MTFMDLEDPRYAYMFGFLQMDGTLSQVSRNRGRLSVELSHRDIDILRAFQLLTPYNSQLHERTRSTNFTSCHRSAIWSVHALEARRKLMSLGFPCGAKSLRIKPPRVPFSRPDYLRGVIDADGSVGFTSQGLPFLSLTTASTAIATYLCYCGRKVTGGEKVPSRNQRDGVYNIMYMREHAVAMIEHLYYPGCLALERKRAAAEAARKWVRPSHSTRQEPRPRWKAWEDELLLTLADPVAVAVKLGRPEKGCRLRLWRLRTGRLPLPRGTQVLTKSPPTATP
jgi:hypothetical protein